MENEGTGAEHAAFPFWVLVVSLTLALVGDFLLRGTPWGLNVPIFVLLCGLCAAGLVRKRPVTISRTALWMLLPIGIFSLCFFWRDSDDLKVANLTALVLAIGVLVIRAKQGRLAVAGIVDYTFAVVGAWFSLTAHFANLITKDLRLTQDSLAGRRLLALFRGLILACPLLLIFGALFASADAAFSSDIQRAFSFDAGDAILDALVFAILALFVGGLFRRLFLYAEPEPVSAPPRLSGPLSIGLIEIATVFTLIDALFIMFVVAQFRYFFGGWSRVMAIPGLTFSDYARTGFFELTVAATLTLPIILGTHALLPRSSKLAPKVFAGLSAVLVLCVLVVLTSAMDRMLLYVHAYGLSETRLFTTAFMIWLAVTLIWLAVTVLRNRRDHFAFGALAAGFAVILGLNYANPDALIAKANMDPAKRVDVSYLSNLSVDAASTVIGRLGYLKPEDQRKVKDELNHRWNTDENSADWRSMNMSRIRWENDYKGILKGT